MCSSLQQGTLFIPVVSNDFSVLSLFYVLRVVHCSSLAWRHNQSFLLVELGCWTLTWQVSVNSHRSRRRTAHVVSPCLKELSCGSQLTSFLHVVNLRSIPSAPIMRRGPRHSSCFVCPSTPDSASPDGHPAKAESLRASVRSPSFLLPSLLWLVLCWSVRRVY